MSPLKKVRMLKRRSMLEEKETDMSGMNEINWFTQIRAQSDYNEV